MIRVNHRDFDISDSLGSSLVHFGNLLRAFLSEPTGEFGNADHDWIMLLTDFDGVADVVPMTVGAEQDVDFPDFLFGLGTGGISHDPRINNDGLAARSFDPERRMAQPRKLNAFQIHDGLQLLRFGAGSSALKRARMPNATWFFPISRT